VNETVDCSALPHLSAIETVQHRLLNVMLILNYTLVRTRRPYLTRLGDTAIAYAVWMNENDTGRPIV